MRYPINYIGSIPPISGLNLPRSIITEDDLKEVLDHFGVENYAIVSVEHATITIYFSNPKWYRFFYRYNIMMCKKYVEWHKSLGVKITFEGINGWTKTINS